MSLKTRWLGSVCGLATILVTLGRSDSEGCLASCAKHHNTAQKTIVGKREKVLHLLIDTLFRQSGPTGPGEEGLDREQ